MRRAAFKSCINCLSMPWFVTRKTPCFSAAALTFLARACSSRTGSSPGVCRSMVSGTSIGVEALTARSMSATETAGETVDAMSVYEEGCRWVRSVVGTGMRC
eukprot:scaffold196_cov371-Prasinococcus_capsulatus_cf.AAC.7